MILGVPANVINDHGAVSEETARSMAEKVRDLAKTDFAFSTTGNLGPDVLEDKERGLIYIAVSSGRGTVARQLRLDGDRESNKETTARRSLELLLEVIEES